jgi:hypothetical protein
VRLLGGRLGRQVRIDVLLPKPKPSKDMRWHVQRVRGRCGNLRACC